MANTTGIAVGCAVGIPSFLALVMAAILWHRNQKKLVEEDEELAHVADMTHEEIMDFNNYETLRAEPQTQPEETSTEISSSPVKQKRRTFIPAYRQKLNDSLMSLPPDGVASSRASSINLNTSAVSLSAYDQMIPVLPQEASLFTPPQAPDIRRANSDTYLRRGDNGSYPTISGNHTRESSMDGNIFGTPPRATRDDDPKVFGEEIAEEDQYENDYTNYSESKRDFINSLRPKKI